MPTCAVLWQLKPIINHLNQYDKHKHIILERTTVGVMGEGETINIDCSIQFPMINTNCHT